jgi:hypothetical protein
MSFSSEIYSSYSPFFFIFILKDPRIIRPPPLLRSSKESKKGKAILATGREGP